MVTSNFTCGAEKRLSSSEASAEANIELCTGQGQAWEVSENHSAHLEWGCRLSPLYPQPQALLQSPQILVLAFLPLLQQLAPPSISPAWGFPPCMGFSPLPPRSKHDYRFPSLPLPGTEWTLGIFKGASGREPLLSPSRVTAHVQSTLACGLLTWPSLKPWEAPKRTCTPTLSAITVLFKCEIWELR